MSFAVFVLFLCPFLAIASQEKPASNFQVVRSVATLSSDENKKIASNIQLVQFEATFSSKENNRANATNTNTMASAPPVASKFSFNSTTDLLISMKSKRLCKKRLSGLILGICNGCIYDGHENIELKKSGENTQKDDKKDKLNATVKLCCNESCGFADIKKLCCDGNEFRKTKI